MSFDLLNTVKAIFTGDFPAKAAQQLSEREGSVQKALNAVIPVVLTGLLSKVTTPGDAGSIFGLVKDAAAHPGGNISHGVSGGLLQKGSDLLQVLFGDKNTALSNSIAEYAGIKASSAGSLLQTSTPAVLGAVGKYAVDNRMNPLGFMAFLNNHKDEILNAVPSGLGLPGILGIGSLGEIGKKLSGVIASIGGGEYTAAGNTVITGRKRSISVPIIMLLVIILILWWLLRGCGNKTNIQQPPRDTVLTEQLEDDAITSVMGDATARTTIKVSLPGGRELDAYRGGIEDRLVSFLNDPASQPGKDVWFDFDNLNFATGSAQITAESQQQVNNLAAILDAFPKAKIKIGGYTDKQGDSLANYRLSKERAEAVVSALTAANVKPAQLLGAEGYGQQFAKAAANAPDEERKKDRRISVSVRAK